MWLLVLMLTPTAPLDVQAARLELDQRTGLATFSGGVEARQDGLVLRCATLTARYAEDGGITDIEATGGVTVTNGDLRAEARTAHYTRAADRLELSGSPTVWRGKDRLTGARIIYWPRTGRLVVEQARGRIEAPRLELPRAAGVTALLEAVALERRFGRRTVVADLHLRVSAGEVVALLGPNGAGKTTTFRMLAGLLRPDGGRVLLGGEDVSRAPLWRRARAGLGYLPQEASIFRALTVAENLAVGMRHRPAGERVARVDALLERFELAHLADAKGHTLSGGERRRVEILRAFAATPRVLLVDEPFAGLDPRAAQAITAQLRALAHEGVGVVITDHRVSQAFKACDRVDILSAGRAIFSGSPAEAAADDQVRALYLGDLFAD